MTPLLLITIPPLYILTTVPCAARNLRKVDFCMNRNVESHFAELPSIDIERSMFDRSSSHKTSFNVGELIPFFIDEVLPGDTFNVTTSAVVRLQTLLTPVMDNMYLDTYFFFVPNRIVWEHWKEFMGENTQSAWIPTTEYRIPTLNWPTGTGWNVGTIADYFGIPVGVRAGQGCVPSALPFRAYAMICDQWFRDQNVSDPLNIPLGDAVVAGSNGDNYITDVAKGGKPFKVAKYHDYFTSCLPAPQKSASISIFGDKLPSSRESFIPVFPRTEISYPHVEGSYKNPMLLSVVSDGVVRKLDGALVNTTSGSEVRALTANVDSGSNAGFTPINLWANVGAMNLSINELRLAFQLQKFFEKNARAGTRYREVLKEHFSVSSPDARMMIPEYLGGHRIPLQIHQIANQSQGESDFLGDLGAMSNTSDVHDDFVKSFTEHGYVIGVCCVRYDHSYPQGLERFWTRQNSTDFYWPVFANIGEQPVYKYEIMVSGTETDTNVFGYQEAWADYRFKPNRVSGEMRPGIDNSLASWHLSDYYTSQPSLSDAWIREDKTNVDRTLAVTSSVSNQVFADFYIKNIVTRAMPMYSIPGLIDHH